MSDGSTNLSVTPGRGRKPASPESITTAAAYGFRARRTQPSVRRLRKLACDAAPRNDRRKIWRVLRYTAAASLIAAVATAGAGWWWIASLGPVPRGEGLAFSTLVVDRDGRLLRPYTTPEGRWRLPATREDVDPRFLAMLYAYEDRRFLSHQGVDPLALGRAFSQLVVNGRIVSGASTLTMQVARLLEPRSERSFVAKLRQMVRAVQLERMLSKDQILALYFSLAPYGGNLEGIRAASLAYFGKEPRRLTLAESALLVALPQSPEVRRPDRSAKVARAARDRVLDRLAAAGVVPADEIERAKQEAVVEGRRPMPALAPHSADAVMAAVPNRAIHRLTIQAPLQKALEDLARERARTLGPSLSVAILVVDNETGEVHARVASSDYFDAGRAGQVDMTQALRSPGSALKPFIYGLGFEDGLIHPETLIDDRPIRYGNYAPENFDLTFQGTVTVRRALQLSLNVPAVAVLERVGASRFTARLAQAGGALVLPRGEAPGLAMGLGGVGVTLNDLVMLYAGVARLGNTVAFTERMDTAGEAPAPRRLMEPVAAWYLGNVMLGTPPPENAARGRIAFKTGTSYGYRDAWAVGFDGKRTIGVWVGRPDGAPVPGLIARHAAAPILFDAFARTGSLPTPLPAAPRGTLAAATGSLPPPLQRFRPDGIVGERADTQVRIMFPPNGARLELANSGDGRPESIALKLAGGVGPLTVLVNGLPVDAPSGRRNTVFFEPEGPGFVRLTVIDSTGSTDSVLVRLQ
ncbi:MAG: penicillin-binding protein 1C [Rhizobiales bacterium]|nr:penicillin-binding protein 1C [Hyphomicrobiales bacterium]